MPDAIPIEGRDGIVNGSYALALEGK
jgi:hypothetical protein